MKCIAVTSGHVIFRAPSGCSLRLAMAMLAAATSALTRRQYSTYTCPLVVKLTDLVDRLNSRKPSRFSSWETRLLIVDFGRPRRTLAWVKLPLSAISITSSISSTLSTRSSPRLCPITIRHAIHLGSRIPCADRYKPWRKHEPVRQGRRVNLAEASCNCQPIVPKVEQFVLRTGLPWDCGAEAR